MNQCVNVEIIINIYIHVYNYQNKYVYNRSIVKLINWF